MKKKEGIKNNCLQENHKEDTAKAKKEKEINDPILKILFDLSQNDVHFEK